MSKPILEIFQNKNKVNHPVWLMRQAGRYLPEYRKIRSQTKSFLDLCYDVEFAKEVTLQPIRRFNLDAAIIFSDILVIPDAMGIEVNFKENEGPVLGAIQDISQLKEALTKKELEKLNPVYQALAKVKQELPSNVGLIGFSGAPWTLASYIVEGKLSKDFSTVKSIYYNDKKFFSALINHLTENVIYHLKKQIEAGAEIIQIFDSWAGMLIEEDYLELVIKPTKVIVNELKKTYPNIPIICFPRMSGFNYQKFCQEIDCDAIGIDQYVSLKWVKEICNDKIIQGNLEPLVLLSKSQDLIKEKIDKIFDCLGDTNFIFNLGHGVVPKTPVENVEFLVNYVKKKT